MNILNKKVLLINNNLKNVYRLVFISSNADY
jgi:hypothetical protein